MKASQLKRGDVVKRFGKTFEIVDAVVQSGKVEAIVRAEGTETSEGDHQTRWNPDSEVEVTHVMQDASLSAIRVQRSQYDWATLPKPDRS